MKAHKLKKTTLLLGIQIAVISSTSSYALTSRNSQQATINQLVANDQSLRRQQNQLVTELNNLQEYTKAQSKNYDDAIENLIKQNNELIELNQNMLAELEKLDKQVDVLTTNTATNKKNTLSLTQATTKKVKEIQSLLDKQDKRYDDLSNKGKALLIGLCILSLLLGALLWSMLRKLNKQTLKLKSEIERVLNQMQANTDSSIAELKQQQTETLHQWKKDIDQEITATINQTLQNSTNKHLAEIKQKTSALMADEKSELLQELQEQISQTHVNQSKPPQSTPESKQETPNSAASTTVNLSSTTSDNNNPQNTTTRTTTTKTHAQQSIQTQAIQSSIAKQSTIEKQTAVNLSLVKPESAGLDSTGLDSTTKVINEISETQSIDLDNNIKKNNTPESTNELAIDSKLSELDDEISPEDILAALDSETAELAAKQDTSSLHFDAITDELIDELDDDEIDLDDLGYVTHTDLPKATSDEDSSTQNTQTEAETKAVDTKLSNNAFNKTLTKTITETITENSSVKTQASTATDNTVTNTQKTVNNFVAKPSVTKVADTKSTPTQSTDTTDISHGIKDEIIGTTVLEKAGTIEEAEEIEAIDPTELFNTAIASENKGNTADALTDYNQLITTFESDDNDNTTKLVGLALDKKAKLLLSDNRVKDAIDAYDQIISGYDSSNEDYAKNIVSNAILNSALLELTTTGSINGSKVGTARTVFRNSPENMLAMEAFETLRLSARRDVTSTQQDLLEKYAETDLINMDWRALDNWAQGLNSKAKPRVQETIAFFKNWNDQPSLYS